MAQHCDPINLPGVPKTTDDRDLLDWAAKLQNALQFTFDQLTTLVNNGLLAYYIQQPAQAVTSGAVSIIETMTPTLPVNTTYSVLVTPSWTTSWSIGPKNTSTFQINFGTTAGSTATIDVVIYTRNPG